MTDVEPPGDISHLLIRDARAEDAAQIAQLAGELGYPTDAAQMQARLALLAALPGHWVGVAAVRAPAGQASALRGWVHVARCMALEIGEYAEILGLVVGAQARRGGAGRQLVAAAERWSRDGGLARITVRSNVARTESHRFYPSLGFVHTKSQHIYAKPLSAGRPV